MLSPSDPLMVVAFLFVLSLVAAVILFAFFKSTAFITTPKYQAGGAIAGFLIVYALLYPSYKSIASDKQHIKDMRSKVDDLNKQIDGLKISETAHENFESLRDIGGTVTPYHEHAKVILGFADADLFPNRKFRMRAPCVDASTGSYTVFVMHDGISYPYSIEHTDDITALQINGVK